MTASLPTPTPLAPEPLRPSRSPRPSWSSRPTLTVRTGGALPARRARVVALIASVAVGGLLAVAGCSSTSSVASGPGSTTIVPGTTPGPTVGSSPGTIIDGPTATSTTPPKSTPGTTPGTTPRSTPGTTPRTGPPTTRFVPSPPPVAAKTEDGAIYLALIRNALDRTRRDPSGPAPYAEIVIVDHGVPDAGEGTSTGSTRAAGPPFSEAVRADLVAGLGDLGPVHFASSPKAGAVTSKPGDEHVLVIAGPIERIGADGTTVHVGLSKTCGPMCGSGGTDVLQKQDGQWVVTGATGSGWIN